MNRMVHFEIQADNPEALIAFYSDVFGWEIGNWGGPQKYWLVTTGPDSEPGINGAILERHFKQQAVINTSSVEDLDATLKRIDAAGGKKIFGPNEIPGVGVHAYCEDPDGNLFGILQPAPNMPS
ncbi:MAG: VOC family protein [Acidiferrobacterales bacterium]